MQQLIEPNTFSQMKIFAKIVFTR